MLEVYKSFSLYDQDEGSYDITLARSEIQLQDLRQRNFYLKKPTEASSENPCKGVITSRGQDVVRRLSESSQNLQHVSDSHEDPCKGESL